MYYNCIIHVYKYVSWDQCVSMNQPWDIACLLLALITCWMLLGKFAYHNAFGIEFDGNQYLQCMGDDDDAGFLSLEPCEKSIGFLSLRTTWKVHMGWEMLAWHLCSIGRGSSGAGKNWWKEGKGIYIRTRDLTHHHYYYVCWLRFLF